MTKQEGTAVAELQEVYTEVSGSMPSVPSSSSSSSAPSPSSNIKDSIRHAFGRKSNTPASKKPKSARYSS